MEPEEAFLGQVKMMESAFKHMEKTDAFWEPGITQKLINAFVEEIPHIPVSVARRFARTRFFIYVRERNKEITDSSEQKRRKKIKKLQH